MALARLALCLVAVSLVACGGGEQERDPSSDTLSRRALVDRLDGTCRKANAGVREVNHRVRRAQAAGDGERIAVLYEQAAATRRHVIAQLEQLDAPADDRAAFRRYLHAGRRLTGIVAQQATAIRTRDANALAVLNRASREASREQLEAALDLGLEVCGRG